MIMHVLKINAWAQPENSTMSRHGPKTLDLYAVGGMMSYIWNGPDRRRTAMTASHEPPSD
jgi:hypothetical protein